MFFATGVRPPMRYPSQNFWQIFSTLNPKLSSSLINRNYIIRPSHHQTLASSTNPSHDQSLPAHAGAIEMLQF